MFYKIKIKNMKSIKLGFLALAGITVLATSCRKEGCTDETAFNYNEEAKKDDGTCQYENTATIKFTQSWDDQDVTVADFNDLKYANANNETMSLTKLQYSISDIRFYKADGDSVMMDMYHFIDVEDANTLTRMLTDKLDPIEYTGIGFIFGFTPEDNISGAYLDLNAASWNWPDPIGGGYHQMKMEGRFIDANMDTISYQFHNGSATKPNDPAIEAVPNYIFVKLDDKAISMNADRTIEIDMQIGEWYKNPNLWDLNALHSMLMPNKDAQLLISENGLSVFRLGEIK